MKKRKRLVRSVKFSIGKGKSLVISLSSEIGLDRVIVENEGGVTRVTADGHSGFEFSDKKQEPGMCDFWLGNPSITATFKDYLEGRFWGQFNWGELFRYQKNAKLRRELRSEIQKLADEFESNAERRLNGILKRVKNKT